MAKETDTFMFVKGFTKCRVPWSAIHPRVLWTRRFLGGECSLVAEGLPYLDEHRGSICSTKQKNQCGLLWTSVPSHAGLKFWNSRFVLICSGTLYVY